MTDDIVTRLRDTAEHHADLWPEAIVIEAADEIKRLQTENPFLMKALVRYGCEYVDIVSAVTEWGDNE